jgi:RNA polymerase sigma-70 factor (ECF subfamily)
MTSLTGPREAQFERLYALARDPLARYLARRVSADAVEDLFAEVMTVAWRRLEDVPPNGELPWLFGVGRRVLANHRRSQTRFGRLLERLTLVAPGIDPGHPAISDGDPDLDQAMTRLSLADADVLRMWAWEELAPAEIAVALGITPNAASIRLHRAKGRLRGLLEAEERKITPFAGHQPGVERKETR